jgi:hypothetical protein
MGFWVGGSFVSAYLASPASQQRTPSQPQTLEQRHELSLEDRHQATEEAIAYYNLLLTIFTAILAVATILLFAATLGLYSGGKKQLELSRDAERRELRAYIGHWQMPFDGITNRVKYFDMNYGRTPARDVSMYVRVVSGGPPSTLDDELTESERQQVVQIVHPGQNVGRIIETATLTGPNDQFFLYGYVNYTDIFDYRWRHRFAFSYNPAAGSNATEWFVAYHQYNNELPLGRDPKA